MDNDPNETPRVRHKLERLLEKMRILGSRDVSITLHARPPNMNQAQFEERFVEGARKFCRMAAGVVPDAVLIENFKAIRTRSPRVVFDAVYPNLDAEYRDVSLWEKSK